jgi:ABC-type phosphate/phosphonate transport system substrate-binding protein
MTALRRAMFPMYDWPEEHAVVDRRWAAFRDALRMLGIQAPDKVDRSLTGLEGWLSPDLLIGETCTYPLETSLRGKVRYVATPARKAPGCERPGFYRSAIIMRGAGPDAAVPGHAGAELPGWDTAAVLAFNGMDSMSGFHALSRDCMQAGRDFPAIRLETGSHRASVSAVASGLADIAAIDCFSFQLARTHDPAAMQVRIAGWAAERPALPLVTALSCDDRTLSLLRQAAAETLDAHVLDRPTER